MSIRTLPIHRLRRNDCETTGLDLSQLDRPLRTEITHHKICIGRLVILACGGGWLKIDILCPHRDQESELLNPELAVKLLKWLSRGKSMAEPTQENQI